MEIKPFQLILNKYKLKVEQTCHQLVLNKVTSLTEPTDLYRHLCFQKAQIVDCFLKALCNRPPLNDNIYISFEQADSFLTQENQKPD